VTPLSDAAVERLRALAAEDTAGAGRYELIDVLGRGGMGVVWRARDRDLDREVALKLLDDTGDEAVRAELAQRLLREARVLARLEHPGIVPVHDAGRLADGRVYYAMKRVHGRRLDEHVRDGCPLPERLRVFERLCEAVAFAHSQGVLHRDLKPENVMVGAFGEVLVLDWGVARAAQPEPAAGDAYTARAGGTAHGTVLGTPGYMAPEQARGDVERLDARTDVYALGGVLYFLLTGRAPGDAETATAASTRTWRRDGPTAGARVVPPRRLAPETPARLGAVALKALSCDPGARYASVAELQQDVARFLAGESVTAYRESPLERAGRLLTRHRTAALLLLVYLAMRVGLILVARR
jgi:serine/threonine protein kinase